MNQLPEAYLRHWFELIHTFREQLPVQESILAKELDFDWDALVGEVMKSRRHNNRQHIRRVETLLSDQ